MLSPSTASSFAQPFPGDPLHNDSALADLVATVAIAQFDPDPVSFAGIDERGVRVAIQAIKIALESPFPLTRPVNRKQFLAACLDHTETSAVEHLIVGLGKKQGATTKIDHVLHAVGSAVHVELSAAVLAAINAHYRKEHKAEVVVFHNHPQRDLHALVDNLPIASAADRRLLLRFYLADAQLLKRATGGGRVRFFLGENRYVAEFTQPHWLDLLRSINF